MLRRNRSLTQLSITAAVAIGLGFVVPALHASADPSPAAACVAEKNVWVLVEFDDRTEGGCASEFANGLEALASAGFEVEASAAGFVNTVDGEPAVRGDEDWWSYAHSDEVNAAWDFYLVGAKESAPVAGTIEGWRLLHSYAEENTLPTTAPVQILAEIEVSMSPSPSATEPSSSATPIEDDAVATPNATARPTPALPKTGN